MFRFNSSTITNKPLLRLLFGVATIYATLSLPTLANHAQEKPFDLHAPLDVGRSYLTLTFDAAEARAQYRQFPGDRPFDDAIREALSALLQNDDDAESPLALTRELCDHNERESHCARSLLIDFLHRENTHMDLISRARHDARSSIFAPERGELVDDNWLFFLTVPALSDHLFWIIVPRTKQKPAYIYGFN